MTNIQTFERDGRTFTVQVAEQHAWFWEQVRAETWENETFAIFKREITPETLYVDIGTWIGPTVLYGASLARRVAAVEPDAVAMAALVENLSLNEDLFAKTDLYNFAIAPEDGAIELYAYRFGDSMTSLLPSRGARKMTFLAMGFEKFLGRVLGDETRLFIKLDTEGAEYDLIPNMCRTLAKYDIKADLYVSLHGSFLQGSDNCVTDWARNLHRHASVLSSLASHGTISIFDGEAWRDLSAPPQNTFASLLATGGLDTTLFVKAHS